MSYQDKAAWAAMLDANPALQAAWNGFTAQLARDTALLAHGIRSTGQALTRATGAVLSAAAETDRANDA